jgi:hypothetical protein
MAIEMYIMASEPISTVYLKNPSHQYACLCNNPPIVARQLLDKNIIAAKNTQEKNRGIVGYVVSYAVRVVLKESKRLVLPRISCCIERLSDAVSDI